ncbi:hypothetical protein [Aestuariibacter salexigens]|uniref:hypothetical protein n=1 Tax=Aestuariibacter salexigens TaxID=226010 RepID=UPI0004025DA8|nr:hypothetical protein [Aestuariibacter salexigens]
MAKKKTSSQSGSSSSGKLSKDKQAGSSTQSCPLKENKVIPCDVGNLELIVVDSNGTEHKAVTTEPRTHRDKPLQPKDLPYLKNQKYLNVGLYDAVLEVLAPPLRTDATEVKKATVAANVSVPIGTCPKSEHPKIVMRNPNYDTNDGLKSKSTYVMQSVVPMDIYGKSMPVDKHVAKLHLRDTLYFFEDSRKPKHIKDIVVEAEGCGVRDDGKKPNKKLIGLIRVYREDKYVLEISIPSVVSKESSYTEERGIGGAKKVTEAKWSGGPTQVTSYENGAVKEYAEVDAGYFTTETETLDGKTNEITKSSELSEFAKLTRNGIELPGLDTINKIIATRKSIVKGFSFIDDLRKAVPQVGFGWSFKLDVLAGTIGGEWGIEAGSNHDTAEYKWVEPYGQINLAMSLVKLEFATFFGVECKSPGVLNWFKNPTWEVIAKIELKLSLDCKAETSFRLAGKDDADRIPKIGKESSTKVEDFEKVLWTNEVVSSSELYAQFKVTVVGYGMDSKAGVAASMSVKFTVVKPFRVRGEGKRNEAYLYAYFTHFKKKKSPPWKKTICKEKQIFKPRYIID